MRKTFLFVVATLLIGGCATVQEAKNFANCRYSIRNIEVSDYNINSITFDVYVLITNLNKKTEAAIKKFEGKLMINDTYVSDINFENIRIEAGATKTQKAVVSVPMKSLSTKMVGLVSMGSASVDYHIIGTAYFETPLGDVPIPVNVGRRGSNN